MDRKAPQAASFWVILGGPESAAGGLVFGHFGVDREARQVKSPNSPLEIFLELGIAAQCGFTRFFRFAGLLPIGVGSAKRNDGRQCAPQAKKMGGFGERFVQKTRAPRRVVPAAG